MPQNLKAPNLHPEGIVFGMPEDAYHADPALGSTDLKTLMRSAADYWWSSWMNDDTDERAERETPKLRLGSALHKRILEGVDAFHAAYAVAPEPDAVPGMLKTADDLRAYLRTNCLPATGGKSILLDRVRAHWAATQPSDAPCPIWDDIICATADGGRKTLLNREEFSRIELIADTVAANPFLAEYLTGSGPHGDCVTPGYSEVSVFWREVVQVGNDKIVDVPCKARFDRLTHSAIIDLKTTSNPTGMALEVAIPLQVHKFGYDLQASHYMLARERARQFVREQKVYVEGSAEYPSDQWLQSFERIEPLRLIDDQAPLTWHWLWVFLQTSGAPIAEARIIRYDSDLMHRARAMRSSLLRRYAVNASRFGTGMWVHPVGVRELEMKEMPLWPRFRADPPVGSFNQR